MKNVNPFDRPDLKHLELFFYLIPIIGFFPSLWTLYRHENQSRGQGGEQESKKNQQLAVSRLSITLSGCWLLAYLLLNMGAETSELLTLRLLVLNTLLTSAYFLVSVWLMVRLASGKSPRLPGFSSLAERVGKYLS